MDKLNMELFRHLGGKVHYVATGQWQLLWTLCGVPVISGGPNGWVKTTIEEERDRNDATDICKRCLRRVAGKVP